MTQCYYILEIYGQTRTVWYKYTPSKIYENFKDKVQILLVPELQIFCTGNLSSFLSEMINFHLNYLTTTYSTVSLTTLNTSHP